MCVCVCAGRFRPAMSTSMLSISCMLLMLLSSRFSAVQAGFFVPPLPSKLRQLPFLAESPAIGCVWLRSLERSLEVGIFIKKVMSVWRLLVCHP